MNDTNRWGLGKRLLAVLGVGLLLVLAWIGGRVSAGGAAPFGMMGGGMHGDDMMQSGYMHEEGGVQGGEAMQERRRMGTGDFEGEAGLQRCRAMMGTMAGMHRSMQSMMGGGSGSEGGTGSSDRRGHMGGGMMRGQMGETMGPMHERMGSRMDDMSPETMRRLCRTMHTSMRAAMHGEDVASAGEGDETAFEGMSLTGETEQWLRGARAFDTVEDRTGRDEVVVEVGAGDGLRYAPAAVRVDPGTTVRWRWTGRGGLHDVAFANADIGTPLKDEKGATFEYTFDAAGEYRYECTPHAGVGMRGAVIVAGGG
ncbi:MAG: halocyanin domain-containing protein [Salinivenus sp.]